MTPLKTPRYADTTRTPEQMGRDAIGRTEAQVIGTSPIERTSLERDEELFTINMGPHHPATHGVLRLLVSLEGEVVRDLKPVMGYVHTGIEKSCEQQSYWKVIPFVERMDYLSYFFNMQAFCGATEKLLELEIPPRAEYLRILHMELNRIHSHLVGLGTTALDLGAISMFWYCFRERDTILDLFEMSTGQRMHTRYFQVGGVIEDIPVGFERKVKEFCALMPGRIDEYVALLDQNEIFLRRTKNVGIVDRGAAARDGGDRPAVARRRRALGPAQGRAFAALPGLRLPGADRDGRRQLRPLSRPPRSRCASRCGSSSRRSTACPRVPGSPTTARWSCPRATSSGPRWRR